MSGIGPFTSMQAAIWSALEERLEDHIRLDLNDPAQCAAFSAMVEQVETSILRSRAGRG